MKFDFTYNGSIDLDENALRKIANKVSNGSSLENSIENELIDMHGYPEDGNVDDYFVYLITDKVEEYIKNNRYNNDIITYESLITHINNGIINNVIHDYPVNSNSTCDIDIVRCSRYKVIINITQHFKFYKSCRYITVIIEYINDNSKIHISLSSFDEINETMCNRNLDSDIVNPKDSIYNSNIFSNDIMNILNMIMHLYFL